MIQDHLWSTVYFKGLFSAQLLRCYWQPVHIQLQYSDDVIVGFLLQLPDSDRVLTMQRTVKLIIIIIIVIAPLTIVSKDQWGDLKCLYIKPAKQL